MAGGGEGSHIKRGVANQKFWKEPRRGYQDPVSLASFSLHLRRTNSNWTVIFFGSISQRYHKGSCCETFETERPKRNQIGILNPENIQEHPRLFVWWSPSRDTNHYIRILISNQSLTDVTLNWNLSVGFQHAERSILQNIIKFVLFSGVCRTVLGVMFLYPCSWVATVSGKERGSKPWDAG